MHQIDSPSNSYIKHLFRLIHDSEYRKESKKILIEGTKLISEVIPFVPCGTIFSMEPLSIAIPSTFKQVLISETIAKKLSSHHASRCFAEVALPQLNFPRTLKRLLALDAISDPGNLGTLMRTALSLNWEGIFLLPGCCDPFNDKVIRSSKGALFQLPYVKGTWDLFDVIARQNDLQILTADLKGQAPESFINQRCILILGNESQGLSKEALDRGKPVSIPIQNMESLNVSSAGAILMYILRNYV